MLHNANAYAEFERRFREVAVKLRLTRVLTVLGWAAVAVCLGLVALASVDFFFETNWGFRAVVFSATLVSALVASLVSVIRRLRNCNRAFTASRIEQRFSDLGQSVRTSVEMNERSADVKGVSPSLLNALREDVNRRTEKLDLIEAVPARSMATALWLLAGLLATALLACVFSWEWRTAAMRTLLSDPPYTTVRVEPGDTRLEEKATFTLSANVGGRIDREVALLTRDLDSSQKTWTARPLMPKEQTEFKTRHVAYQVSIPKVKKPFQYRVVAGKYASSVHSVDVRYPIAIKTTQVEITPPAYTRLGSKIIHTGSFDAVEGAHAKMHMELDHSVDKAWLELRPMTKPAPGEEPDIQKLVCSIDGAVISTEMELTRDHLYRVFAEAADGNQLRQNRFRIRVHADREPRLAFESPDSSIEVHKLAELNMRLKVSDDYGLVRAGIVFQVNNEPELMLVSQEFEVSHGQVPTTDAKIASLLPLEYFDMTVKDSVSYYAYAEDNMPGRVNRSESDLHFIDIRPFRRRYPIPRDGLRGFGGPGGGGFQLPLLSEIIGRERFVLNRTRQIKRGYQRSQSVDENAMARILEMQNETSEVTGLLGDAAFEVEERLGIQEERISDALYLAQELMVLSVDSLSRSEFELATLQEKDSVRYLIAARDRLEEQIGGLGGGYGGFFARARHLMQRLRGLRTDRDRSREIVRQLRSAAARQDLIMEGLEDLMSAEEVPEDELAAEEPDEEIDGDVDVSLVQRRRDLERQQSELAVEVEYIADSIGQLQRVSELVRRRTARAVANASSVNGALQRGDTDLAITTAPVARSSYQQLAWNIEGITAMEVSLRIAIARDLATRLNDELRRLSDKTRRVGETADAMEEDDPSVRRAREAELAEPLAEMAQRQAEFGKTMEDVLKSIEADLEGMADQSVPQIQQILSENKFEESVQRLESIPDLIDGLHWSDATIQSADLADRTDILSQRLDALYRAIVAPRIDQLRKLEERAIEAKQRLDSLRTEHDVTRWHLRADGLIDDAEKAEVLGQQVQKLRETFSSAGWGDSNDRKWNWSMNPAGTGLVAPEEYVSAIDELIRELQRYIRELTASDVLVVDEKAIPPKYVHLVERYFEVLTGQSLEADE